jgi:hypothetical protein
MLLEHVGESEAAALVGNAVQDLFTGGRLRSTGTDSGVSTTQQGDSIRDTMRRMAARPAGTGQAS